MKRALLILVLSFALGITAAHPAPKLPSGGVIPTGERRQGESYKIDNSGLVVYFTFVGRMPAGPVAVNVSAGSGSIYKNSLASRPFVLMTGTTPGGAIFEWACDGVPLVVTDGSEVPLPRYDEGYDSYGYLGRIRVTATCSTSGRGGKFRILIDLVQFTRTGTPSKTNYDVVGTYLVDPRPL
jgi:hypothetical protein